MASESLIGLVPDDWEQITLGEICNRGGGDIQTGPFGSQLHASDYVPVGVPSIMPQNIGDNRIVIDGIARIKTEDAERLGRYRVRPGDVVYSRRGDVERRALIRDEEDGWLCGTGCLRVRFGEGAVDPLFASYYLGHPSVREWIVRHAVGATMLNLNTSILSALPFVAPPLPEQICIARVIGAFDDKIDLNRQMNATLEHVAQALFKSWFVDFDFPGFDGNLIDGLPKEWKKMKLEELIDTVSITHKFPTDQIIFLNTSDILDGQVLHNRYSEVLSLPGQAKKSIKKNDILYSEIRPANRRYAYVDFDAQDYVVSTKLMVLRAKSHVDPIVIYYYLKQDEVVGWLQILAESRSGTFPQITFQQVKNLEMIVPDEKSIQLYTNNLKAYFEKVNSNHRENNRLSETRNALLPRLISGQLRIPEAEAMAGGEL